MANKFVKDPLKVFVINPLDSTIMRSITFIGDAPKAIDVGAPRKVLEDFYGARYQHKLFSATKQFHGSSDTDREDIEELLNKPASKRAEKAAPQQFIRSPGIYPEDNFEEIKEKIYLTTGIPVYKQHLFYYDKEQVKTTYQIFINGANISTINILAPLGNKRAVFDCIPLDKRFYDATIRVDALDRLRVIGLENIDDNAIFIVDLSQYIGNRHNEIKHFISDEYQLNLLYNGFILKFWPHFTRAMFKEFVDDEKSFTIAYPDLAKNKIVLQSIYADEKKIMDYTYAHSEAISGWARAHTETFVTRVMISVLSVLVNLNLRNIFDNIALGEDRSGNFDQNCQIMELKCLIAHEGRQYMLRKSRVGDHTIKFPVEYDFARDLTVAIKRDNKLIFINVRPNGKITAIAHWGEVENMTIKRAIGQIMEATNSVISRVNTLGHFAFISGVMIPLATQESMILGAVSTYILWKKSLNNLSFTAFLKRFEALNSARIIIIKQLIKVSGEHEYLMRKGAYAFQISKINQVCERVGVDDSNMYVYLSNSLISGKWAKIFAGQVLKISHRTTAVAFNVNSGSEAEYASFSRIILGFLYHLVKSGTFVFDASNVSLNQFYKTRKLKQEDPELYDLKRQGAPVVYARLCMQNKQPVIYTDEEISAMPAKKRDTLTKYYNFTTKRPAYYGCPNREFPEMSFITGYHPKNYCLPCCTKLSQQTSESKKNTKNKECLARHVFTETETSNRHAIAFGKDIQAGRLNALPPAINKFYYGLGTLYAIGVAQRYNGVLVGALHSFAYAVKAKPADIINKIIALFADDKLFYTLLQGALAVHFANASEFVAVFTDIFVAGRAVLRDFDMWNELFIELCGRAYGINCILYRVNSNTVLVSADQNSVATTQLQYFNQGASDYCFIYNYKGTFTPIANVVAKHFFDSGAVSEIVFGDNNPIIVRVLKCFGITENILRVARPADYLRDYTVQKQYVNKSGLVYGCCVSAKDDTNSVYIPLNYINPRVLQCPAIYDVIDVTPLQLSALEQFLQAMNEQIIEYWQYGDHIVALRSTIGVHYCAPTNSVTVGRAINYAPVELHAAILNGAECDNAARDQLLAQTLYNNYQYRLFVMEFANYVDKERDELMRDKINEAIHMANFSGPIRELRKAIKAIELQQDDYVFLWNQVARAYYAKHNKDTLLAQIKNSVYRFDKRTIKRLTSISLNDLKRELQQIVPRFAIERNIDVNGAFPNTFVSCSEASIVTGDNTVLRQIQCSGPKLIVRDMVEMIEFLANDLHNELKRQYFLSDIWVTNYIDFFSFITRPNERVQIYAVENTYK